MTDSRAEPEPSRAGLGAVLARGIMWVGLFRWSGQVISWACTLVVIRLLLPADYGIVGMTTYFIGVTAVLSEFAIGAAVVVTPRLSSSQVRQLHALSALLGAAGTFVSVLVAGPLSRYFGEAVLAFVLPALGTTFFIDGFRTVPLALMSKDLDYRRAASSDFVRAVASAAVVLVLAALGAGYWALVAGMVGGSLAATGWVTMQRPTGWSRPRYSDLVEPVRYCRQLLVGRLAFQGYYNADLLIAGRLFGAAALGSYNVAWTIASLPGEKLTTVVNAAVSPFFASLRDRPDVLRHYTLRLMSMLGLVIFPPLVGFLLVADLAVPVVLGIQWIEAVAPARALVCYAALQSVSVTIVNLLSSIGKTEITMRVALLNLAVLPAAFVVGGTLGGIAGIAWAWTCSYPFLIIVPVRAMLRLLGVRLGEFLASFQRGIVVVGSMSAVVLGFRWLAAGSIPAGLELLLSVLLGAAVAGITGWVLARDQIASVRAMIGRGVPVDIPGGV